MDEELETLVVRVRADTSGFAADVARMRELAQGPLADGLERAGDALENGLSRAIRRGVLDFDDLKSAALSAMAEIASAAISSGIGSIFGGGVGGGGGGGGIAGAATSLLGAALGLPGRATGGPVTGGRAYMVGERGPELFVPTGAGHVAAPSAPTAAPPISLTINLSDTGTRDGGEQLRRSSRQVARSVAHAVERAR